MTSLATGPLHGVRVIDLATERADLAGRVLADLGADVIVVEPPGGSPSRRTPPFAGDGAGESLYWAAVALGKHSVALDLESGAGRAELRALVAEADVLVESFDPGVMDRFGLGHEALCAVNPGLVYVSVTPFGQAGPEAHSPASDLTLQAAGGLLGLQGDPDRRPVPVGYPQAYFHAGVQAAADVVIALNERARSGRGQHLDVSIQAAVVWTLMNATGYPAAAGGDPPRTGEHRAEDTPEVVPGVALPRQWQCADGYAVGGIGLGALGARTLHLLMAWLAEEGGLPAELGGIDWNRWSLDVQEGRLSAEQMNGALAALDGFLRGKTKWELLERSCRDRMLLAPVLMPPDLAVDPQLAARDYWTEVGGRVHPGAFARLSRTPVVLGAPAPALGRGGTWRSRGDALPAGRDAGAPRERAFAGLKVADFAWVGVGPLISKALADHGATVVHVESVSRPDVLRLAPPYKDGVAGMDRAQFMANFNSSKLGLALDLATDDGRAVARRLIDWADVVVESFTPGTMARMGLDYATVSVGRPELIMLSTCLRGQTGPQRGFGGFGNQGAALAGLHGMTGWPDRPPAGTWGAYTDFIAPRYGVAAIASAILERRASGLGQYIDLSQVEAAIHFIEPLVLDYTVNGVVAERPGDGSPTACPHGVYPAAGAERYMAIAVETAAQWRALLTAGALPSFHDAAFGELAARLAQRGAIDAEMAAWTCRQDPWEVARLLKDAGVPVSVVLRPSDLFEDPQLAFREFFVPLEHTVMGRTPYDGLATHFSATPGTPRSAAPCLGEHTELVLGEFLGLDNEEIARLAAAGALS